MKLRASFEKSALPDENAERENADALNALFDDDAKLDSVELSNAERDAENSLGATSTATTSTAVAFTAAAFTENSTVNSSISSTRSSATTDEFDGAPAQEIAKSAHKRGFGTARLRALLWVQIPAVLTALMGALNLWSAATPSLRDRVHILREFLPQEVRRGSHLATALTGFALLLLALSLWRRKRVGWIFAVAILLISFVAHLTKGLDYEEAACALGLALWLLPARRHFHARSDAPSVRQGVLVLAAASLFTLVYGTVGFYLLDTHFRVHFGLTAAMAQTVTMFTQFYDPGLEPVTHFGKFFADSIYGVALCTFSYAALMLIRPVVMRDASTREERQRARHIIENYGRTAFAFCALFDDKTYWFSAGGSVVAYAIVGRVAVAMGDPLGPREDAEAAIHGWVDFCHRNDWRPSFYEVYDEYSNAHRDAGLVLVRVGHEAVVDVQNFSLAGKENKNTRNVINSLTKQGYRAEVHLPPLSDAFFHELRDVSNEWLAMMNGSEKQFSLGFFEEKYIRSCPIMAVHDAQNNVMAFANIVSEFQLNESTVDLMRRRPECAKGTMEFLFVSLFEWAKTQGFDTFNVGPSPFAMVGEQSDDPATEKAMHFIYEHINQFYNFKGLHAFKEKFHPEWRPLFLAYSGAAGLPAVAAAIIRADSGQSSWWRFLRHLRHLRGGA